MSSLYIQQVRISAALAQGPEGGPERGLEEKSMTSEYHYSNTKAEQTENKQTVTAQTQEQ